jgi:hypothetical protein
MIPSQQAVPTLDLEELERLVAGLFPGEYIPTLVLCVETFRQLLALARSASEAKPEPSQDDEWASPAVWEQLRGLYEIAKTAWAVRVCETGEGDLDETLDFYVEKAMPAHHSRMAKAVPFPMLPSQPPSLDGAVAAAIEHGRSLLLEIGGNCEESWQQNDKTFEVAAQLADALARCVGYPVYNEDSGEYEYAPPPKPEEGTK